MNKTLDDYMNDSRMLEDPAMAGALEPVKEIHVIRLMLQDETAGMGAAEKAAYRKQCAAAMFSSLGLPPPNYVNLSGNGKHFEQSYNAELAVDERKDGKKTENRERKSSI